MRNTQVILSGNTPMELAMGRRPREHMDPAFMNPEQLTSTSTKQDFLNEEIQKLAMQTHLEIQQREDIRRDLAERMKFVPPDLRVGESGESVFYWQEDPSKIQQGRKSGKWLKVEIIAVKGPWWLSVLVRPFSCKCKQTKKTSRSKGQTRKKSCLSCDVADGLFGACLESAVTTRLDLTSIALTRDPPLFLGDGDLSDVNSGMRTKDEWVRLLQSGVVVALDGEPVTLTFERES